MDTTGKLVYTQPPGAFLVYQAAELASYNQASKLALRARRATNKVR
jgi:hypothetical protein